jgi:mannose-6-phosphate isomerase-like protein (cupin superfamily)
VLEGEFTVYTDTQTATLTPGGHIFIPMNTHHAVVVSGKRASRALTVASPSRFAKLIREVGFAGSFESFPSELTDEMSLFLKLS